MIPNYTNAAPIDLDNQEVSINGELYLQNQNNLTNSISVSEQEPVGKHFNISIEMSSYIKTEQSWEGCVEEVFDDYFVATLTDLNNSTITDSVEIKNIAISDQDDEALLKKGAVFFWEIGRKYTGRKRELVSTIKFRRLPTWTEKEINHAKKEANEISNTIGW